MAITHEEIQDAISAAVGWAGILRRHADEAQKAADSETPNEWTTDKAGWETLSKQLNEAADVLVGMGNLVATIRAQD